MIQFDPSHHYIIHYLTSHFPKFPFVIGIFETSSSRPQIHFLFFANRFFFFSSNIISIFFNFWYIYSLIIILVPLVIILFPNSHFFHVFISFFNSMFSFLRMKLSACNYSAIPFNRCICFLIDVEVFMIMIFDIKRDICRV